MLFKSFNSTDVCKDDNWWKIYIGKNSDEIEITLTQGGSTVNEKLIASVTGLKMYAKSWFLDKSTTAWTVKFLGGKINSLQS